MTLLDNNYKAWKRHCSCQQALLEATAVKSGKQSASSLEAIFYILPESAAAALNSLTACQSHEDKGLLTVIYADTDIGLQVG